MTTIDNNEFDNMREQLSLLKEKLAKEEIVNDRLMRQTMQGTVKQIHQRVWLSSIFLLFFMLFIPKYIGNYGMSTYLLAYSELILAVTLIHTWYTHRGVKPDMMNGNLLEVSKRMRKLKDDYRKWHFISYPMVAIFLAWFGWEFVKANMVNDRNLTIALFSGLIVGSICGGIAGHISQKKLIRSIDDIISQIES